LKKHHPEAFEGPINSKSRSRQKPDALRERAEKLLSEKKPPMPPQDALKVLHELEVHQIELEMQNEALQQSQATLIASQERYADLYDFAPIGYFTFDRMGLITQVNLTGASLLGVERGRLSNKPFSLFVAAPSQDTFHRHYRGVLRTGTADTCELQLTRKGGTSFYASVQSVPVRDAEGNLTGVRSAIGDITDRKRAGELLQKAYDELEQRVQERTAELSDAVDALQSEINERRKVEEDLARQAELLNLTHDAIIARDLNHRVFFWNRGAEERYGWSSNEVKGKATNDLLKTVFPQPWQEIEQELLTRGRWEGEVIHTTRDGRKIIVASRRALRRDRDGKSIAILEINSDITEEKRIEAELLQSQKMEALGTLAGGIAHDFNNILTAMLGFSELAVDEIPADSKAQRHLATVHKAGLRGRDLVKQILAFSRKSQGERKQISLVPLIQETHALLRASLPTTIRVPRAITTSDDYVLADPTQIQQVLMNLATNAAHAMQGGGQLTIGVSSVTFPRGSPLPGPGMEPGTYVKLTVKDTGTGMPEEVRQRIFEPFFTTKEPGKGTGMGLAVVYGIVRNHGGAVTVQSEPGRGSTFEVFLPRAEKPEVNREEETIFALPTGTERVLFVDDEEMLVEMARDMLENLGYRVTVAKHPTEARNLFLEDPWQFDLVITDQTMPEMTGVELAEEILVLRPDMPVILCTGFSHLASEVSARAAGVKAFLMKPLTKREIAQTVRRVLDG
jgi:PAS domain S-box-containing protein